MESHEGPDGQLSFLPPGPPYPVGQRPVEESELPDEEREFVHRYIKERRWRAATSERYKDIPHEYVVFHWEQGDEGRDEFRRFTRIIREHGYRARWGKGINRYLNVGGHRYWYISPVINRETMKP